MQTVALNQNRGNDVSSQGIPRFCVSAVQDYSKNVFLNALPDWALSLHVNCDDPEHWTYDDVHCFLAMFFIFWGRESGFRPQQERALDRSGSSNARDQRHGKFTMHEGDC